MDIRVETDCKTVLAAVSLMFLPECDINQSINGHFPLCRRLFLHIQLGLSVSTYVHLHVAFAKLHLQWECVGRK